MFQSFAKLVYLSLFLSLSLIKGRKDYLITKLRIKTDMDPKDEDERGREKICGRREIERNIKRREKGVQKHPHECLLCVTFKHDHIFLPLFLPSSLFIFPLHFFLFHLFLLLSLSLSDLPTILNFHFLPPSSSYIKHIERKREKQSWL